VHPLKYEQHHDNMIELHPEVARSQGARYTNSGYCSAGHPWCFGPTSDPPTLRSILDANRCFPCSELSERVWRGMATRREREAAPSDEDTWNVLLPGARFRTGWDRYGAPVYAKVPNPPDFNIEAWRRIPAGIHIGEAARSLDTTLPPHGQGIWRTGFSERHRQFFFYLLGEQNISIQREWRHPGDYRILHEKRCRYVKAQSTYGANS